MKVEKPVFVLGSGRCGSTIFHQILAEHPNLAWLSVFCDYFPNIPAVNRLFLRMIDVPAVGTFLKSRRELRPWEPYNFWLRGYKGFKTPCRDLTQHDVSHKVKKITQLIAAETLTSKRHRLLAKVTGWPRIDYFSNIFEDARFIHVVRDGRAVVNSMLNVPWWWGWQGPQNWRWGELTADQYEEWTRHDRSFVALAAIEWNILMNAVDIAKQTIDPANFLEIRYEDLCVDPVGIFRDVAQFCELPFPPKFEKAVKKYKLRNSNNKWQTELNEVQQQVLNQVLQTELERYGYK
jgi:omega-hydroxy-beta-dihydromenaquinone-9 sulfotransferase